jgi:hypothetical protein
MKTESASLIGDSFRLECDIRVGGVKDGLQINAMTVIKSFEVTEEAELNDRSNLSNCF